MTTKTQITNEAEFVEQILSNGMKIKLDPKKANGHLLMKCRQMSGGAATVIYMVSEIATFDGEKIPAPELLNLDAFTIIEIEEIWASLKK